MSKSKISLKDFNNMVKSLKLKPEQAKLLASNFTITETVITCELKTGVSQKGNQYCVIQFKKNNKFVMSPMMDSDCVTWIANHPKEMQDFANKITEFYTAIELAGEA